MDVVLPSRALRFVLTAAALIVALALVAGVRPRVLAEETGVAPLSSSTCFLCDGAATAATVAPAAHAVAPTTPAPAPTLALSEAPVSLTLATVPGHPAESPPVPPPRA
jgi:hypothetical protein